MIPSNLIPTTTPEETTPEETTIPTDPSIPTEEPTTLNPDIGGIYNGCGDTKVCFGVPDNCYSDRSCEMLGAVTYNSHNFTFELLAIGKLSC